MRTPNPKLIKALKEELKNKFSDGAMKGFIKDRLDEKKGIDVDGIDQPKGLLEKFKSHAVWNFIYHNNMLELNTMLFTNPSLGQDMLFVPDTTNLEVSDEMIQYMVLCGINTKKIYIDKSSPALKFVESEREARVPDIEIAIKCKNVYAAEFIMMQMLRGLKNVDNKLIAIKDLIDDTLLPLASGDKKMREFLLDTKDKIEQMRDEEDKEIYDKLFEAANNSEIDINKLEDKGASLLLTALEKGYKKVAKQLLRKGVPVDFIRKSDQKTALIIAFQKGYEDLFRLILLKTKGDENSKKVYIHNWNKIQETIISSVPMGLILIMKNYYNYLGKDYTNLMIAVKLEDYDLVKMAIEEGLFDGIKVDEKEKKYQGKATDLINVQNKAGETAVELAFNGNRFDIIKLLIDNGAKVDIDKLIDKEPNEVFRFALRFGKLNVDDYVTMFEKRYLSHSDLVFFVEYGHIDLVKMECDRLISPKEAKKENNQMQMAVELAIDMNRIDIIKLLIVKLFDQKNFMQLIEKAYDSPRICGLLTKTYGYLNAEYSRLMLAVAYEDVSLVKEEIARLVLSGNQQEINYQTPDPDKQTALKIAGDNGHVNILLELVKAGCNILDINLRKLKNVVKKSGVNKGNIQELEQLKKDAEAINDILGGFSSRKFISAANLKKINAILERNEENVTTFDNLGKGPLISYILIHTDFKNKSAVDEIIKTITLVDKTSLHKENSQGQNALQVAVDVPEAEVVSSLIANLMRSQYSSLEKKKGDKKNKDALAEAGYSASSSSSSSSSSTSGRRPSVDIKNRDEPEKIKKEEKKERDKD